MQKQAGFDSLLISDRDELKEVLEFLEE